MTSRRPIIFTLAFWLIVAIIEGGLMLRCGFGAGWDEASNFAIMDCRSDAQVMAGYVNFFAIAAYSLWAVVSIKRLSGRDGE